MKRRYTMDQYRADVARIYSRKDEPPSTEGALAKAIEEGVEILPAEELPRESAAQSQPPPAPAGFTPRFSGLRQRVRRSSD